LINFDSTPEHPWEISRLPFMTQRNGYDCGPIACAKIMDYYGMWPQNNKPHGGLRKFVVNHYKQMMLSFGENMFVRVPVHTINLLDSSDDNSAVAVASDDSTSATQKDLEKCMICLSRIQKDSTGMVLNCCGKSIHGLCVAGWLQHQDTCPYCREIVDEIEVDGHKIPLGNVCLFQQSPTIFNQPPKLLYRVSLIWKPSWTVRSLAMMMMTSAVETVMM
jgi:hypothetical protein